MGWAVVKFSDEDAVEAVPRSWYIEASEECFWPPANYKREKIVKLIERNGSPLSDWKVYTALMLGYYDDFAVAQRKAKKATLTTDLSSGSDIYKGTGSRIRKKNPRYESQHSSDSDESRSSSSHISYPVFKRTQPINLLDDVSRRSTSPEIQIESTAKTVRSDGISHENNESNDMAGYDGTPTIEPYERRATPRPTPIESCERRATPKPTPRDSCERRVTSKPSSDSRVTPKSSFADRSKQLVPLSDQGRITPKSSLPDRSKQLVSLSDQDFKRMMIDEMNQLNYKMNNLIESIATLMKTKRIETDIQLTTYGSKIKILYGKIPLRNDTDLEDLETYLADDENFKIMISELSRIGGSSLGQSVRKILYRLLTDEVALLFSWDGARMKRPFKSLRLARCILESMKIQYIDSKEMDTITVIKSWLVKARERITNPIKRRKAMNKYPFNV
ncbi:unnamed protein product [Phaedon cochleariae]|uniref:DUF4806 domain-containing protein n=1 Tax=Phaedon cochleariae TaxID=80249 RepID=A0A9P0DF74_PHACE|nr:unnamed protein product [Phaedon cochleariae]